MRHEQRRHKDRDDDGPRAVNDDVAGDADERGEERENALKGKLQKFDQAGDGEAHAESDGLRADGNTPVAEQRVTEGNVHTSLVRTGGP
jgi:hypothetical protein